MLIDDLLYHLHHPGPLDQLDEATLKNLIHRYPYLTSLKSIYLKKSGKQTASSHKDLYERITELVNMEFETALGVGTLNTNIFDLKPIAQVSQDLAREVDSLSANHRNEESPATVTEVEFKPIYPYSESSFIQFLNSLPQCKVPVSFPKQETIAKEDAGGYAAASHHDIYKTDELIKSSLDLRQNIGSESLANLWLSQGKPELAIQIYEKLIVEYPEKSATFAAKIQKLKAEYSL